MYNTHYMHRLEDLWISPSWKWRSNADYGVIYHCCNGYFYSFPLAQVFTGSFPVQIATFPVSIKLIYCEFIITFTFVFWFLEEKCRGFYTLTPGSEKGKWIHHFLLRFCGHFALGGVWNPNPHLSLCSASSPPSAAMMWLSLSMELMYVGLLFISCTLLSVQLCIRAWFPSTQRWGQLLNAFAAVFTVLGGTAVFLDGCLNQCLVSI